jgi:hypothetical protein
LLLSWVLCEVTQRIFLIIWSLGQRCASWGLAVVLGAL